MRDGFINVLKPPGLTSHDVVGYMRRILKIKKIGHTGTLDPGVAGVLPLCLGKATRLAEFVTDIPKSYRTEITFGVTTDTQDAYGQVLKKCDCSQLTVQKFIDVLPEFTGQMNQLPPMVSAVKVGGRRLCDLVRSGIEVERTPKNITVYNLQIVTTEWDMPHPKAVFDVVCSKGTYIRTICHDIGSHLGVGAYMSFLVRTSSGPFCLNDSYTMEEISALAENEDWSFLQSAEAGIPFMPAVILDETKTRSVIHGNQVPMESKNMPKDRLLKILGPQNNLLAVGHVVLEEGSEFPVLKPVKVFVSE